MHTNKPSRVALERAQASIGEYLASRRDLRQASRADLAKIEERQRELLLGYLDPSELKALAEERRKVREARIRHSVQARQRGFRSLDGIHAAAAGGAIFRFPPYDFSWTSGSSDGTASADQNGGTFSLAIQGFGDGNQGVAAGVGFSFFSGGGNPSQRCAAVWDYNYDWWDDAQWYVAHNDGNTCLWVFGESENAWVAQSNQSPHWSDGESWLGSNGNSDSGRVSGETFFSAQPNSWYQCWLWSSASIYTNSGFFGFSDSSIHMDVSVPLFVLGSVSL